MKKLLALALSAALTLSLAACGSPSSSASASGKQGKKKRGQNGFPIAALNGDLGFLFQAFSCPHKKLPPKTFIL